MNENRYSPPSARVADPMPAVGEAAARNLAFATKCLWISLAIGAVNFAVEWPNLKAVASTGMLLGILAGTFALLGVITYHIGRAKNWARIVLLIFAIIGLPSLFQLPAAFARNPLSGSLNLLQSLLQFAVLYTVFLTSARRAFSKRTAE